MVVNLQGKRSLFLVAFDQASGRESELIERETEGWIVAHSNALIQCLRPELGASTGRFQKLTAMNL